MREPVRDRERLEHIKDAIKRIQDNIKIVSMDNLSSNVLVFYGIVKKGGTAMLITSRRVP